MKLKGGSILYLALDATSLSANAYIARQLATSRNKIQSKGTDSISAFSSVHVENKIRTLKARCGSENSVSFKCLTEKSIWNSLTGGLSPCLVQRIVTSH